MNSETEPQIMDDLYLAARLPEAGHRGPVMALAVDMKDIALGGLDLLRKHPVGSIEVGGAIAASGLAARAAWIGLHPRHV